MQLLEHVRLKNQDLINRFCPLIGKLIITSAYLDIAWWDATTIGSLTGATSIADGYTILTGYLESNT